MEKLRVSPRVVALVSAISIGAAFLVGRVGATRGLANTRYLDFLIAAPCLIGSGFGFEAARTGSTTIRAIGVVECALGAIYGCMMIAVGIWGLV
jgi:hypothetical protein